MNIRIRTNTGEMIALISGDAADRLLPEIMSKTIIHPVNDTAKKVFKFTSDVVIPIPLQVMGLVGEIRIYCWTAYFAYVTED